MILLWGVVTSLIIQVGKWLIDKIGYEMAKFVILGFTFLISLAFTILQQKGIITLEMITTVVTIFSTAIATYEVIIKRFLGPAIDKIFG